MTKKFLWRGEAYEAAQQEDLSWMEMEQVEQATGLTSDELQEDKKAGGRARVIAAMCWVSVHRQNEAVTFDDFFRSKISELEGSDDGEKEESAPPPPDDDPLGSAGMAGSGSEGSATST